MKKVAFLMLSAVLFVGCAQNEVANHSNQAENPTSQVINGTPSVQGARPYQVALLTNGRQGCGGTILSEQWVLTAGHCVGGGSMSIRAGSLRATSGGQALSVARAIKHPNYSDPTRGYDIAVLKLSGSLQFNKNVQPAVLPTKAIESQYAKLGTNLIISGWGMTRGGDTNSNSSVLREAPMPVISNSACGQQLGKTIGSGMICGDKNRSGQTGCHGDSGGPYVGKGNGKTYVFGAVSWGTPRVCNKATVFARVSEYQPWITKTTGVQPDQSGGQNKAPVAAFRTRVNGLSVQLSNNSSDPDGDRLNYEWDFGNGDTSSQKDPTVNYRAQGTYTIKLTVSDGKATDSTTQQVTVSKKPGDDCEGLKTFNGNLAQENYSKFHSSSKGFQCSGSIKGVLSSRSSGDFDLYLQKKEGARWVDVAYSNEEGSNEIIIYNAADGVYRWEVYSYQGSGDYTLVGSRN